MLWAKNETEICFKQSINEEIKNWSTEIAILESSLGGLFVSLIFRSSWYFYLFGL